MATFVDFFWFKFIIGLLDFKKNAISFKCLFEKIKRGTCLLPIKKAQILCILTKKKINFVFNHKRFSCYWLDYNCYLQRIIGQVWECENVTKAFKKEYFVVFTFFSRTFRNWNQHINFRFCLVNHWIIPIYLQR